MIIKTSQYRVERQFNGQWHKQGIYKTEREYDAMLEYVVDYELSDDVIKGLIGSDKIKVSLVN